MNTHKMHATDHKTFLQVFEFFHSLNFAQISYQTKKCKNPRVPGTVICPLLKNEADPYFWLRVPL